MSKLDESEKVSQVNNRRLFAMGRLVLLFVLAIALIYWLFGWIKGSFFYVHETDARVMADLITISSEVEGRIVKRFVSEGNNIKKGDPLIQINSRLIDLKIQQIKAEYNTKKAELSKTSAEHRMIADQIEAKIESENAKLLEARANKRVFDHEVNFLKKDFARVKKLLKKGAISRSKLERVETNFRKAEQQLIAAEKTVIASEARIGQAEADRKLLDVKNAEKKSLEARLLEIQAKMAREVEVAKQFQITSNMDGVVGRTLVNEGEVISKGQRLLVLHSPEKIWVETNIRETDISRLKLGQRVEIEVDAYPEEQFEGTISRIGNAATSQFAILPKLNEAGSFTKVTQRLRVRIEIDQRQSMLRPGMMVEVFIKANDAPFRNFLMN